MRLRGLMRKEFLQILRDPCSIAIAFLLPLILLLSVRLRRVPGCQSCPGSPGRGTARSRIRRASPPPSTSPATSCRCFVRQPAQAAEAGHDGRARERRSSFLRQDFARRLRDADAAPIHVIVNGVDANTGSIIGVMWRAPGERGWSISPPRGKL